MNSDSISHGNCREPRTVYAIDIGVYRHGIKGDVLMASSFAWARLKGACQVNRLISGESTFFEVQGQFRDGRSIRDLSSAIIKDLAAGERIALGIEAPMWQPAPRSIPRGGFDLTPLRFAQESGYAWYLQSGAAATVKALSTATLLLSLVAQDRPSISFSTSWEADADVLLFEAFVAGGWKLPTEEVPEDRNTWDARTAAAAFDAVFRGGETAPLIYSGCGADCCCISHWRTVLDAVGFESSEARKCCSVVGIESRDYGCQLVAGETEIVGNKE